MATYKAEHGFEIKHRSSDPSNLIAGEIWYNTTTQQLKVSPLLKSWASGGNINTSRNELGGLGTTPAGLVFGGYTDENKNESEEYDGSSWTEGPNINTTRRNFKGAGTQTAAFAAGGYTSTAVASTENYDGTNWTNSGNLNTARYGGVASGTQTAGLLVGGTGDTDGTEEYDGSSWTAANDNTTDRRRGVAGGTLTATIYVGGDTPPGSASSEVEEYDGTNWTAGTDTNVARTFQQGWGTQSLFLNAGGSPAVATSESWDNSAWTTDASMSTGRGSAGYGGASSSTGFVAGGKSPHTNVTEEYTSVVTARSVDTT